MNNDNMLNNPLAVVQTIIAEALRVSEWMKEFRVSIIEQNSQGLRFLLQKASEQMQGIVLVVGVTHVENNPPVFEMYITVEAKEYVLMNRESATYATALDAVQAASVIIEGIGAEQGQKRFILKTIEHQEVESGVLVATATFQGQIGKWVSSDYDGKQ